MIRTYILKNIDKRREGVFILLREKKVYFLFTIIIRTYIFYGFIIINDTPKNIIYYDTRHTLLLFKKNQNFHIIRKGSSYDYEKFFKYIWIHAQTKTAHKINEFSFFKKFITYLFHQLLLYCNIFIAISYGNSLYNFHQFIIFDWIKIQCNNVN